jgi:hypothetical protein
MNAALAIELEFRELVPRALQTREPAKVIALRVGATPRAVEGWRNGYHGPTVPHFLALAQQHPEIRAFIARHLGFDAPNAKATLESIKRMIDSLPEEGDREQPPAAGGLEGSITTFKSPCST